MKVVVGRSQYPKLAKHLDHDLPRLGHNAVIVRAFEKFTAYHPKVKLSGYGQKQFQFWLGPGNEPPVRIFGQMQMPYPGLTTGLAISQTNADRYERGEWRIKVGGALSGKEVYQVTAQVLGQLVMWAIWYRDRDQPAQWEWSAETPAQAFLDCLYGPKLMFW